MAKRKAALAGLDDETAPKATSSTLRRSTRHKPSTIAAHGEEEQAPAPVVKKTAGKKKPTTPKPHDDDDDGTRIIKSDAKAKVTQKARTKGTNTNTEHVEERETNGDDRTGSSEKWYWLMKAEPQSRLENGVDVKFSIDDLASKTEPEPWDGIRAYAARNNLRSMKKGELAFFYHSNCKEPSIVGTMEIVREHSPDVSAHDPKAPYYDPSSKLEDPKWSVVHVKFHSKFAKPIGLKELREMGKPGKPLENMQMLKQSRLSVSRVSPFEWDQIMDLVQRQGGEVSD